MLSPGRLRLLEVDSKFAKMTLNSSFLAVGVLRKTTAKNGCANLRGGGGGAFHPSQLWGVKYLRTSSRRHSLYLNPATRPRHFYKWSWCPGGSLPASVGGTCGRPHCARKRYLQKLRSGQTPPVI